jgi:isopentenyl phosphate kinase
LNLKLTILKLGGSVITHKQKPLTANLKAIKRLAKETSESGITSLILIHGGGSFGHPLAKQYAIKDGYKRDVVQALGFSKTHQAMLALNKLVVDALLQHNIPAVAISPSSCIVTKSGRIQVFEEEPLSRSLQTGFVPVLYGDAVFDSSLGFTILSGDQLAASLAIRLNAKRIIMGIDVDGLYTADPKLDSSASLIQHCTLHELKNVWQQIEGRNNADVTGGMPGKIKELIPAINRGISTLIINAAKPKNVYKALKGEKVIGTLIVRERS